jgi:Tfp pilus assembly protein PilF
MHARWHLSHAQGYLALGLHELAAAELDALPPEAASETKTLALRLHVLQAGQQWLLMQPLAAELVQREPREVSWWVSWAFATRRVENVHAAEAILREAELKLPDEAIIQFNLACYACLQGSLQDSMDRLTRAIALDAEFATLALLDPDLEALRATGWTPDTKR